MPPFAAHLMITAMVVFLLGGDAQTASSNQAAPESKTAARMTPQQAQLLSDTQKLRKLSEELKAEVDKSSKEQLPLPVIKKAQEVEKLARALKEEISKSY